MPYLPALYFCFVIALKLHHGDYLHGAALNIHLCFIDRAIFLTAYLELVAPTPCNRLRVVDAWSGIRLPAALLSLTRPVQGDY